MKAPVPWIDIPFIAIETDRSTVAMQIFLTPFSRAYTLGIHSHTFPREFLYMYNLNCDPAKCWEFALSDINAIRNNILLKL